MSIAGEVIEAAVEKSNPWLLVGKFIFGNLWRSFAILVLLLCLAELGVAYVLLHQRDTARASLITSESARKTYAALCKAEIDAITGRLADAKRDGDAAIAAKKAAEVAAVKQLKARDEYWKRLYAKDPQAKAWASQPIPPSVLDGLR